MLYRAWSTATVHQMARLLATAPTTGRPTTAQTWQARLCACPPIQQLVTVSCWLAAPEREQTSMRVHSFPPAAGSDECGGSCCKARLAAAEGMMAYGQQGSMYHAPPIYNSSQHGGTTWCQQALPTVFPPQVCAPQRCPCLCAPLLAHLSGASRPAGWRLQGHMQQQQHPLPSPILAQQPAAISLNMAPDAPEDAALVSKSLIELQQLWNEWHGFGPRNLPPQQVFQGSSCCGPSTLVLWV